MSDSRLRADGTFKLYLRADVEKIAEFLAWNVLGGEGDDLREASKILIDCGLDASKLPSRDS